MLTEHGRRVVAEQGRNPEFKPKTDRDWDFIKAVACELVFAWTDADAKTRKSLERVMGNVGMDRTKLGWELATRSGGNILIR